MKTSRRDFVTRTGLALTGGTVFKQAVAEDAESPATPGETPLIVSTWPFGKAANEQALATLKHGGSPLDAVEQGIRLTESSGNGSVGLSGRPNAAGVVQLDACIMNGPGHQAGSVGGIEGIVHPISAARRVMERTHHVMLVGDGARMFALEQGLESIEIDSEAKHAAWQTARMAERAAGHPTPATSDNHDTIALLVLGADGTIAGGCSTSGLSGKLPGRVGDSPIIGSGLYVDNEVGAAGATGVGENVMRYCGTFLVVELMRQGLHPTEACLEALRRIARKDPLGSALRVSFVALDKHGRFGAGTAGQGFPYSVTTPTFSRVLTSRGLGELKQVPEGGNRP
ncbi:MAG: N(4)-(beta-N-acetylglucosaminyl)-L-asparaginase [Verrucomicrobiae bacterium]|nr:N(4)-(beta-N-acetylglucosaminyl)-L-asparaginase [Verrucomicrobiae bacterium]